MSTEIRVVSSPVGFYTEICGHVDGQEVMSMTNVNDGEWVVSSSTCLPKDPVKAAHYISCMGIVVRRAAEHGYEGPKP